MGILQTLSDNPRATCSGVSVIAVVIMLLIILICCSCSLSSCFFLREKICTIASPCPEVETITAPVTTTSV